MDAIIEDKDVRMEKDPFAKTASCLIYKGRYGGSTVAVKEFYGSIPLRIKRKLKQEAESLSKIRHDHVVKFYGVLVEKCSLVTEFMEKVEVIDGQEIRINDVRGLLDNLEDDLSWKVMNFAQSAYMIAL